MGQAALAVNAPLRDFEYWPPRPIWKDDTVFCLASGPSLTQEIADKVKGRKTIVVNSSCILAPWADVLYFTDSGWYEKHRETVRDWPGLVICMARAAKHELPDKIKRVKGEFRLDFVPREPETVRQGRSSGHTAISLAIALGAARIVLLGYDMRLVDGREHHHSEYIGPRDLGQYAREFVPAFKGWNADALKVGAEILNCTPGSAITEFPFADLDEVLSCAQS